MSSGSGADLVAEQPPAFTGKPGQTVEPFDTRADALDFARSVQSGEVDPFLSRSWESIRVVQNRSPTGQFQQGYRVIVSFRRPGPGDNSAPVLLPAAPEPEEP